MLTRIVLVLACGVLGSLFASGVQALPVSSAPAQMAAPAVTLVRDFCGLGFHRGPYGYCVRNGVYYGFPPLGISDNVNVEGFPIGRSNRHVLSVHNPDLPDFPRQ
jgi:hypothetical protein